VTHDLRVLTDPDDIKTALKVFCTSLIAMAPPPDDVPITDFSEPGRTLGAFVDGELVGSASSFTSRIVVPGGARIAHAAVTDIGVLPTHARRGLGSALIRRQLQQFAERGELVATLRASEAVIYERFGYGIASAAATVELSTARRALRPGVPAGGPARFVDPKTSWDLLERIYANGSDDRAGTIDRLGSWWRMQAFYQDKGPTFVVVHGEPGTEDGYLRYRPLTTEHWASNTDRTLVVNDFIARSPQAHYGLLRFLLSVDLVHRVVLDTMPVDHSIEKLLLDERAARTTSIEDETWLRLIDVPAALKARSYRGTGSVVLEVTDALLPQNAGRYLISAAGAERTTAPADLTVDVAALAAVYLGGTRWWQLAASGRVAGPLIALALADDLFSTDLLPFAGTMF
jgi:predicted acetyltransferase